MIHTELDNIKYASHIKKLYTIHKERISQKRISLQSIVFSHSVYGNRSIHDIIWMSKKWKTRFLELFKNSIISTHLNKTEILYNHLIQKYCIEKKITDNGHYYCTGIIQPVQDYLWTVVGIIQEINIVKSVDRLMPKDEDEVFKELFLLFLDKIIIEIKKVEEENRGKNDSV